MSISEQLGRITVLQPDSITPRLRKENRIRMIHSSLAVIKDTLSDYEDTTDQDIDQDTDQVKSFSPNVNRIVDVLGDNMMTAVEIMDALGLKHRATFRENYLNPALEEGTISYL